MAGTGIPCEYIHHNSGIHEFIFHEASRAAVDEFIAHINRIMRQSPPDKTTLILIDVSPSGPVPMGYFIERVRHIVARAPHRLPTRATVLYRDKSVMAIMHHIVTMLAGHQDQISFHPVGQRTKAINWLLESPSSD